MNSRERFEAWFAKYSPGCASHSHDLWDAWQEAEHQAFERAAQVCDENIDPAEAAFEIRALIDAQSGEEKAP